MALKTTCNKNAKFTIIKTRTGCQYVGYFRPSESLNWAALNPPLGRGLDMAGLTEAFIKYCSKFILAFT